MQVFIYQVTSMVPRSVHYSVSNIPTIDTLFAHFAFRVRAWMKYTYLFRVSCLLARINKIWFSPGFSWTANHYASPEPSKQEGNIFFLKWGRKYLWNVTTNISYFCLSYCPIVFMWVNMVNLEEILPERDLKTVIWNCLYSILQSNANHHISYYMQTQFKSSERRRGKSNLVILTSI